MPASMAQLDVCPTDDQEVVQHSFVDLIMKYMYFLVILSLLLIQEGQLSVSGKIMHTILVNCLEG